jgi:hypothetical protein
MRAPAGPSKARSLVAETVRCELIRFASSIEESGFSPQSLSAKPGGCSAQLVGFVRERALCREARMIHHLDGFNSAGRVRRELPIERGAADAPPR